jgi:hypothetical protein
MTNLPNLVTPNSFLLNAFQQLIIPVPIPIILKLRLNFLYPAYGAIKRIKLFPNYQEQHGKNPGTAPALRLH